MYKAWHIFRWPGPCPGPQNVNLIRTHYEPIWTSLIWHLQIIVMCMLHLFNITVSYMFNHIDFRCISHVLQNHDVDPPCGRCLFYVSVRRHGVPFFRILTWSSNYVPHSFYYVWKAANLSGQMSTRSHFVKWKLTVVFECQINIPCVCTALLWQEKKQLTWEMRGTAKNPDTYGSVRLISLSPNWKSTCRKKSASHPSAASQPTSQQPAIPLTTSQRSSQQPWPCQPARQPAASHAPSNQRAAS